ncbi:hypothetical protein AB0G79_00380 [Streptomyces sp. NPDC020807]|uniref:hypothetical protein n=1 Tax=Streptomyces sp. NPDC020807 TaxID=3155119 RepID=UPI0033C1B443
MRKLATALVAAGLFFGGMGVAVADSWRDLKMTTTGASFDGSYMWEPKLKEHGGFRVKGYLADVEGDDGHNVYIRARVEGYSWVEVRGTQRRAVPINEVFYDGAALVTKYAEIQVCRDRGALRPDNCSRLRKFRR